MKTTDNFWRTKKYQGKIRYVTLYRERLSDDKLEKLKNEFPDILIVDSFIFYFSAYETWPVERRFGFFQSFTSSYITKIDRKAGRVGALRRWWHVQKMVGDKSCIDKDRSEIDLAGDDWGSVERPEHIPDNGRKIDFVQWGQ